MRWKQKVSFTHLIRPAEGVVLGGNLAENAGGPKAVKYGTTKDYVFKVVLPTGEIIWTGANVLKNSAGYNLTQLIVGSEGTLGIILDCFHLSSSAELGKS